jgi:hypothetical protein
MSALSSASGAEEIGRRPLKAALRDELERSALQALNVAHVGLGNVDGGVEHFRERLAVSPACTSRVLT